MRCYSCGDDSPWEWVHHGHDPELSDCDDHGCHSVCANCDYGLCFACGEE